MQYDLRIISAQDDVAQLVEHINAGQWDEANEMQSYAVDALQSYLEVKDAIFLVCYLIDGDSKTFAGIASARIEHKPYDFEKWLYIDEIDTCSNLRKKGVGSAMMKKLFEIADENDCEEIWLGTEDDNTAANSFYKSLNPESIDKVIGYTFETED